MTEQEREARRLQVLRARLRQDWQTVEAVARRLSTAVDRVRQDGPDEVTVGATALYLQNLYTAVEELLKRIASEIDGSVPSGDDWHRELLDQLRIEIEDIRPAVGDPELHAALDLLRRFRHLVRHAYAAPSTIGRRCRAFSPRWMPERTDAACAPSGGRVASADNRAVIGAPADPGMGHSNPRRRSVGDESRVWASREAGWGAVGVADRLGAGRRQRSGGERGRDLGLRAERPSAELRRARAGNRTSAGPRGKGAFGRAHSKWSRQPEPIEGSIERILDVGAISSRS